VSGYLKEKEPDDPKKRLKKEKEDAELANALGPALQNLINTDVKFPNITDVIFPV
jgi:predicted transcriptional regulator